MAWDAPRRVSGPDSLPRAFGKPFLCVDEFDFAKARRPSDASSLRSAIAAHLSPIVEENRELDAPLKVNVTVTFHDAAVRSIYHRVYRSSQTFVPTERLCHGLVRRIDHCSHELVTRKDSDALNSIHPLRRDPKPRRFELYFEITRAGAPWAQRSFTSYQKHSLNITSAREVMRSTHNMIGMFLKRHDEDFVWKDEPAHTHVPGRPETFIPSHTGPLNLTCIPRAFFVESTQSWEFVPGYSLQLTFKSNNPHRHNSEISRTLKVDSSQATPLNLGLGEDLLWQAYRCVQDVLDQKKTSFDLEHAKCDGFDGVSDCDCQHFDDDALSLDLRVVNNLGPTYEHLHRTVESRLRLFSHPYGRDCDEFVAKLLTRFRHFKDEHDKKIAKMNDFDLRIAELTGHGWQEHNCARFVVEGVRSLSRRSIEALLDRVRTGVADVLRGHDAAIRLIAYKRGHLVLDKGLIARIHESMPQSNFAILPQDQRQGLIAQLEMRIQKDIDMICKDTCSLEGLTEAQTHAPSPVIRPVRPSTAPYRPITPRSSIWSLRATSPGSPGSFKTRPPTPPEVPQRKSSLRVFPLVPAEFKEKQRIPSDASTALDSAIGMDFDNDYRIHDDTVESAASVRVPPVILEDQRESAAHSGQLSGLRPPAEVYRASRVTEMDTDANSTHSSMPALTDGDTPSPDQSLLITPNYMRSASPAHYGLSFCGESDSQSVSAQSSMPPSAANSTTFPDMEHFEDTKFPETRCKMLPSARSVTSGFDKSVLVDTPKSLTSPSDVDKTPLAHRQMLGPTRSNDLRDPIAGLGSQILASGGSSEANDKAEPVVSSDHEKQTGIESDTIDVASQAAEDEHPANGWLLPYEAQDVGSGNAPCADQEAVEFDMTLAEYDSTKSMTPPPSQRSVSLDGMASSPVQSKGQGKLDRDRDMHPNADDVAMAPVEEDTHTPFLECSSKLRVMPVEDELCRSKADFFELDEDSGIESNMTEDHGSSLEDQMTTAFELEDNDNPRCDGTSDVELHQRRVLSPINESALEFNVQPVLQSLHEDVINSGEDTILQPPGNTKLAEELTQPAAENLALPVFEVPEITGNDPLMKAPVPSTEALSPPKPRNLDVISIGKRFISNPRSSPNHFGLGQGHLLPPLPIFARVNAAAHPNRISRSTSSSWEDYVSSARGSSDSVDTYKASPSVSEEQSRPSSPNRLGTPTAGLLGLHESCWAGFGIRSALTDTQGLEDRPATAPTPESPDRVRERGARESNMVGPGPDSTETTRPSPSSPRKTAQLHHKRSVGSIIFSSKLGKKPSKELRKKGKDVKFTRSGADDRAAAALDRSFKPANEEGSTSSRFRGTMMFVAGMAFASSIMSGGPSRT